MRSKLRQLAELTGTEFVGIVGKIDQAKITSGWFIVEEIYRSAYKLCERNGNGASCAGNGDADKMCALLDLTIGYYEKKEVP